MKLKDMLILAWQSGELSNGELERLICPLEKEHHYFVHNSCILCTMGLLHICACGERYFANYGKVHG